uniref:Uncharacterized protein n=1 Tax=Chenopodium quinoa TaxID=63459 RepID=A0A803LV61_CHEQI
MATCIFGADNTYWIHVLDDFCIAWICGLKPNFPSQFEALAFGSTAMCGRATFWFWVIAAIPFYGATWEQDYLSPSDLIGTYPHLVVMGTGLAFGFLVSLLYLPLAIANALTARLNDG